MKNNILGMKRRTAAALGFIAPEKSGQAVDFIAVDFSQRIKSCPTETRASAPFNMAKAFSSDEFCKPSATRLPDGQEAEDNTKFDKPEMMNYKFKI
jgi:hypothetical protein